MKKALLIAFTLTLLVLSFSITAVADSHSQIQACVASGFPADICATCIAALDNGKGDVGPCICRLSNNYGFDSMGECVSFIQRNLR
jgi:hypothetical protein